MGIEVAPIANSSASAKLVIPLLGILAFSFLLSLTRIKTALQRRFLQEKAHIVSF